MPNNTQDEDSIVGEVFSVIFLGIPAAIVVAWFVCWLLCISMWLSVGFNAGNRCYLRGYKNSEVVVNYPKFWHASTVCYQGEGKQNGVKL